MPEVEIKQAPPTVPKQACKGFNNRGLPCQSTILHTDGFCFRHTPDMEANVGEISSKGGKARASKIRLSKMSVRERMRAKVEERFDLIWDAFETALTSGDDKARLQAAIGALAEAYGRPAVRIEGGDQPVTFQLVSLLEQAKTWTPEIVPAPDVIEAEVIELEPGEVA